LFQCSSPQQTALGCISAAQCFSPEQTALCCISAAVLPSVFQSRAVPTWLDQYSPIVSCCVVSVFQRSRAVPTWLDPCSCAVGSVSAPSRHCTCLDQWSPVVSVFQSRADGTRWISTALLFQCFTSQQTALGWTRAAVMFQLLQCFSPEQTALGWTRAAVMFHCFSPGALRRWLSFEQAVCQHCGL
jgi:hypothetical protein